MAQSNDPRHFFQTDTALSESARKAAKRKNTKGDPITLPSKILAIAADPWDESHVYVAEAAGMVKRISLESKSTTTTFTSPAAPLTSLTISTQSRQVFAGCWDKSIWVWDIPSESSTTRNQPSKRRFQGHADFVKCVLLVPSVQGRPELLVSGCADGALFVWDVATGEKLYTLQGHTRAVLALTLDPIATPDDHGSGVVVVSAGTDRTIRRWGVGADGGAEIRDGGGEDGAIVAHETSVDSIRFDADGDLWTASADKTAKCLSRERGWREDTSLEHPDFVRDVVVDEVGGWVVTACRDEEVRVWERASGRLHHVFEGHWEEVTGLLMVQGQQKVVSVSIDGTVRQWSLKAPDLAKAVKEAEEERAGVVKEKEEEKKESMLTEEEERELAELLEDSE